MATRKVKDILNLIIHLSPINCWQVIWQSQAAIDMQVWQYYSPPITRVSYYSLELSHKPTDKTTDAATSPPARCTRPSTICKSLHVYLLKNISIRLSDVISLQSDQPPVWGVNWKCWTDHTATTPGRDRKWTYNLQVRKHIIDKLVLEHNELYTIYSRKMMSEHR